MLGLAGLVLLLGYNNLYFGLDQLSGGNNGWFSLLIPGKFTNQPNDNSNSIKVASPTISPSATPTK